MLLTLILLYLERNGGNGIKLSANDIFHLMELLQSYSSKWNEIGLGLGFTHHELETISAMTNLIRRSPKSYLQELLSQWVQWPTEEHQNNPTLDALCTALRSRLVGLGALAEEVEKKMKQRATGRLGNPHSKRVLGRVRNFCIIIFIICLVLMLCITSHNGYQTAAVEV